MLVLLQILLEKFERLRNRKRGMTIASADSPLKPSVATILILFTPPPWQRLRGLISKKFCVTPTLRGYSGITLRMDRLLLCLTVYTFPRSYNFEQDVGRCSLQKIVLHYCLASFLQCYSLKGGYKWNCRLPPSAVPSYLMCLWKSCVEWWMVIPFYFIDCVLSRLCIFKTNISL